MPSQKYFFPDTLIIVFAREPVAGQVKTRLTPALGENGATELYRCLLDFMISNVISANLSPVNLCITPESNENYFTSMAVAKSFKVSYQKGENLGRRMFNALATALQHYKRALLIGTDCPFLTQDDLTQAIVALDSYDMVFSPALDGGYVLVGASQLQTGSFDAIDWGSEQVMSQTRAILSKKNVTWLELKEQVDIDRGSDLIYLRDLIEFKNFFR